MERTLYAVYGLKHDTTRIVQRYFVRHVPIPLTSTNMLPKAASLFQYPYHYMYCYIQPFSVTSSAIRLSFFKCDSASFDDIETAYMERAISFVITEQIQAEVILQRLIYI